MKMDSFEVSNEKVCNKAKATLKITTLFRFLELSIFFIVLSKFSTQLSFSFDPLGEYFTGLSITAIGPRFAFLVGNAIVLFLISGQISGGEGDEKVMDFYDEYVEKCRDRVYGFGEEDKMGLGYDEPKKMRRCRSEKLERAPREKGFRRSTSGRRAAEEDEMSGEEFRRTVEAFIARQQRILKEEDEEET